MMHRLSRGELPVDELIYPRACALANQPQDAHLANGNAVQLIGKVNPDLSVKVLTSLDLGSNVGKSRPS